MRALLATSVGVLSTATLLLQPAAAAGAAPAPGALQTSGPAHRSESPAASGHRLPGSTRSLPLVPPAPAADSTDGLSEGGVRSPHQGAGRAGPATDGVAPSAETFSMERHGVPPFSLVGVVWADADQHLDAEVLIRTRSAVDGRWSAWHPLTADGEHAPGPASAAGRDGSQRGSTAPLWVGPSDAVQVRVHPDGELPRGLRLELVDPGDASPAPDAAAEPAPAPAPAPADGSDGRTGAAPDGRRNAAPAPGGTLTPGQTPDDGEGAAEPPARLPELDREETVDVAHEQGFTTFLARTDGEPHVGPRPGIVTRKGWGADVDLREGGFAYGDDVKMAFVHHTAGSNSYSCKEAPKVIRGIYRYHVKSLGWRDIGYNFLIDKCGTIYEGRAGGVTESVRGAHTLGFNNASMGIAVLGTFSKKGPSKKATDAVAKLTAWKLGLYGVNAKGSTRMTSGGGKYPKGAKVKMRTISGHRDAFATECPGKQLYEELPGIRKLAARLQGR